MSQGIEGFSNISSERVFQPEKRLIFDEDAVGIPAFEGRLCLKHWHSLHWHYLWPSQVVRTARTCITLLRRLPHIAISHSVDSMTASMQPAMTCREVGDPMSIVTIDSVTRPFRDGHWKITGIASGKDTSRRFTAIIETGAERSASNRGEAA